MIISTKGFKSINYFLSLFVLLLILVGKVSSEEKIIAKEGDTLFKISNEYGVSLKELMHKNNYDDASKLVEGEVIFIPKSYIKPKHKGIPTHKVEEGDTLYKIARLYNIKVNDIINLNRLNENSLLKLGELIILPPESFKDNKVKSFARAKQKVNYHQTSSNEKIADIAQIHNVQIEDIISLNKIKEMEDIDIGRNLQIREDKKNSDKNWASYGLLKVNWSDWRYIKGSYITKVKNKKGKSFFLAVNCEKRRINHTSGNGEWRNWFFPKNDFENDLINDFCNQDIRF